MAYSTDSKSAAVRAQLDHPVIDGDGHWLEPVPIFLDYLREVAGPTVAERFVKMATAHIDRGWYDMTPAERLDRRPTRPTWWGEPANTLDRATAMIPKLFYERLDDFGIDFAMLYTSLGLFHIANPDEELRRAIARAVNRMNAEVFRPDAHRIPPAAVGPVHAPQAATRGRRGLGVQPRDRPARPLGNAPRPRHGSPHATDEPRQAGAQGPLHPLRRARVRGEDGRADELPEPRAAVQVGRGDDRARVPRRAR